MAFMTHIVAIKVPLVNPVEKQGDGVKAVHADPLKCIKKKYIG
jgi:hypothetical protein